MNDGIYLFYFGKKSANIVEGRIVKIRPAGITSNTSILGEEESSGRINYYIGIDQNNWRKDIPMYRKLRYKGLENQSEWIFYFDGRNIRYDIILRGNVDKNVLVFSVENAKDVIGKPNGEIDIVFDNGGILTQKKPIIYQMINGKKRLVQGRFDVSRTGKDYQVKIALGEFEKTKEIVIDPELVYSTYLGGGRSDYGTGIAIDSSGYAYVAGFTYSVDLANNSTDSRFSQDTFIAKISPDGKQLDKAIFFGEDGRSSFKSTEEIHDIAIDSVGNLFIIGNVTAPTFCGGNCGYDSVGYELYEAPFIAKFDANFALKYCKCRDSNFNHSKVYSISVDSDGVAYFTGHKKSIDPCKTYGVLLSIVSDNREDYYCLGSSVNDTGKGIFVDKDKNLYIVGEANEDNYYATSDAYNPNLKGKKDIFIIKKSLDSQNEYKTVYAYYFGGSEDDIVTDLYVSEDGKIFITGQTFSNDFPVKLPSQNTHYSGNGDVFISVLDINRPPNEQLIFSRYIGGTEDDYASSIAVDTLGNIYIIGSTNSSNFPVTDDAFIKTPPGDVNAFFFPEYRQKTFQSLILHT